MSRHRFVRNLDLDAEMADDDSDEETMTQEQQEQMALSLSIAKPLLADVRPPISDSQIQESLWYYYFDVDKTVAYLRRERAKGECGVCFPSVEVGAGCRFCCDGI